MEERETMATFVRGLLDTMPLSSLTQRKASANCLTLNEKVREKYREKFNKSSLNTEQCQLLRQVVLEVASSELTKEAQKKEPAKGATPTPPPTTGGVTSPKVQDPTVSGSDQAIGGKRAAETNGDATAAKKTKPVTEAKKVDEESDDDCVVVECRQADILPHCRADCPVYEYAFTENVKIGAFEDNAKFCDKCFCYICDKKASECLQWNSAREPHCNANSKSACWKARRMVNNTVKFTFITKAMHKYVNQVRHQTIREEAKIVCVEMRETYQQYRQGQKCDAKLVPCNCQCHKQKTPSHWCAKCRSVHDLKKKFDYRPVRAKVRELVNRIKEFTNNNNEKVFLYEIIVSELVAHKGADINQMTQQSGNPDIQAQCNHHDMLKSNDLTTAMAQCFVQNPQLWKEFNDAVRLLFRGQAFPDHFIKGYFEQLQTNINRERGSNRGPRQQVQQRVNNNHQPQIHHMNAFNQFGAGQVNQRMIQPHLMNMNGPPGGPGHGQPPFPGRATTGPGPAGVRSISPGSFQPNARVATTMATSTTTGFQSPSATAAATTATASPTAHAIQSSRPLGTPVSGPTLTIPVNQLTKPVTTFKIMTLAEEDELITRCEDNIKRGQFNQTNSRLKPHILNYRQRGIKFHQDKVIVTYLCCLAHVNPQETLREMWNVYRYRTNAKINYTIGPEDLAKIVGTVIQNVPKRKQVVIVRPYLVPPDWPVSGVNAPFQKDESILRDVFLVLMAFLKQPTTPKLYGNVELLVFALRIFCPTWAHTDGNDLREMIKYYQCTKEILKELEPDRLMGVAFDNIVKNLRIRDKVGNGTTRVFCIVFLLAKHTTRWGVNHPQIMMNLMAHPQVKQTELMDRQNVPSTVWNFVLFALCNQKQAASKMIELDKYYLLEWYRKFMSNSDDNMRYSTVSNYLNIEVVQIICTKGKVLFAIKMFESLFGTISGFLIDGKLTPESKKRHYDKYIEIGTALADRIKDKLINEKEMRIESSGGKLLHNVPEWFAKIEFISSLTFGAAEIQRNRLEILHLFSLYKKTTIQRLYADSKSVEISLQLFGDGRKYPNNIVRNKLQSRVLTSFLNGGVNERQHSEAELFLHELMSQGSPYPRDDITFLKCLRMLMGMSKRRHGKTSLHLVVKPRQFRHDNFEHHCNPNYDASFVTALIVKTMCEGDDDAMEYIHMDYYSLIIEIIADATFSWLKCDLCVKESTKMNEERVKTGAAAALIMINKLQRRKRNTTGFLKTFFNDFWTYVLDNGENYGKFVSLAVGSQEHNSLINAYDLIGKVFIALSVHNDYFQHLITKIRSTVIDNTFKVGVLKFFGVPAARHAGQSVQDEKPVFRVKAMSDIFRNNDLPPMPKLTPKPSGRGVRPKTPLDEDDDDEYVMSNGNNEVNRIYKRNGMNSDDDFVPDNAEYVELNGLEPTKKRTRFETDKQKQERLAQEKSRRLKHQNATRAKRSRSLCERKRHLTKMGFMLPPGFDLDEMLVDSLDVEAKRADSKKTIPKLKLKLT